ncbi:MAG: cyclase family protein [bacterium]
MSPGFEYLASLVGLIRQGTINIVDLTHPLNEHTPVISLPPEIGRSSPGFTKTTISNFDDHGPGWAWNFLQMGEHCGTHFDAPNHWITGRHHATGSTETMAIDNFIAPACVIDVSEKVLNDDSYLLSVNDIEQYEAQHGQIGDGALVLMRTDWYKRMGTPAFLNDNCSPGPTADAMRFLAEQRDVRGFGVEQVGTDAGAAGGFVPPFPAHHYMHAKNGFGLASLAHLDQLPAKGSVVIAAPLKITGGSGSPVRVLALVPN